MRAPIAASSSQLQAAIGGRRLLHPFISQKWTGFREGTQPLCRRITQPEQPSRDLHIAPIYLQPLLLKPHHSRLLPEIWLKKGG